MEHLLKHLRSRVNTALSQMEGANSPKNRRLKYIYQDLLNKIEQALDELEAGFDSSKFEPQRQAENPSSWTPDWQDLENQINPDPTIVEDLRDAFQSTETFSEFAQNFKEVTGREISDQWQSSKRIFEDEQEQNIDFAELFGSPFSEEEGDNPLEEQYTSENGFGTPSTEHESGPDKEVEDGWVPGDPTDSPYEETDEHDAIKDGSDEDFTDLRERLRSIGVEMDDLRDTANVDDLSDEELAERALERAMENVDSIDDVDPQVFRTLAQMAERKRQSEDVQDRTSEELIEWAVGEREINSSVNTEDVVDTIQSIFQDAREEGVETLDMIQTLNERIGEFSIEVERDPQVETQVKEKPNER